MSETRIVSRLNYYMSTVGLKISFVGPLGVDVACEATRLRFCFVGCRLVRCAILIQHDKVENPTLRSSSSNIPEAVAMLNEVNTTVAPP